MGIIAALALPFPRAAHPTTSFHASLLSKSGKIAWGLWGWSDGEREYALVCTRTSLDVYDLADPLNPVRIAQVPSLGTDLRVVRTYEQYAYAVNQSGPIQIIDLSDPANIRTVATFETPDVPGVHTIHIDGRWAYLSLWGAGDSDFRILDLSDPMNPEEVGSWAHPQHTASGNGPATGRTVEPLHDDGTTGPSQVWAHDAYVRGDTAWIAYGGGGIVALDLSNRSSPRMIAEVVYENPVAHNVWLTEDGTHLLSTDERVDGHVQIWDVRDLADVRRVGEFETAHDRMPHNVYVNGERAFIAYYTDGLRVLDITDPADPVEVAFFDHHPGPEGAYFEGAFAVYPYSPSGRVYVTDMKQGLHVFDVDPDVRGGFVSGTVRTFSGQAPIEGAEVRFLEIGKSAWSDAFGRYRIGLPEGWHTVVIDAYGYDRDTSGVLVVAGATVGHQAELRTARFANLTLRVTERGSGRPLVGAAVAIPELPGDVLYTDENGLAEWGLVPVRNYPAEIGLLGFAPIATTITVPKLGRGTGVMREIVLDQGFADDADFDQGWSLADPTDDATEGRWVREDPSPSWSSWPGPTSPDWDANVTPYGWAFHTGYQLPDQPQEWFDVDGGRTTLTSPRLALRGLSSAVLVYDRWFSNDTGPNPGEDPLRVEISNDDGMSWTLVEEIRVSARAWVRSQIRVAEHVTPSDSVRIRFVARDEGGDSVVEAAVDRFRLTLEFVDAGGRPAGAGFGLTAPRPHPAPGGRATLELRLPRDVGRARVTLYDLRGRRVGVLADGPLPAGVHAVSLERAGAPALAPGLYWVRAEADGARSVRRLVVTAE